MMTINPSAAVIAPAPPAALAGADPQAESNGDGSGFGQALQLANQQAEADEPVHPGRGARTSARRPGHERGTGVDPARTADADRPDGSRPGATGDDAVERADAGSAAARDGDPAMVDLSSLVPGWTDRLPAPRSAAAVPPGRTGSDADLATDAAALAALQGPGTARPSSELARGLLQDGARGVPQTRLDVVALAAGGGEAGRFGAAVATAAHARPPGAAAPSDPAGADATLLPQMTAMSQGALVTRAAGDDAAADARGPGDGIGAASVPGPAQAPVASAATPAAHPAAVAVVEDRLSTPLGSRDFAQELGTRVAVFARNGIEHARLDLHPAELGPIALQLALDGTQLRVDMSAALAATRQALEQSLPGLASALADAGLTLSGGGVFEQAHQGGDAGNAQARGGHAGAPHGGHRSGAADSVPALATRPVRMDGLVDLYA